MSDNKPLLLTDHEILALMSMGSGEPSEITRSIFRLDAQAGNELLLQAGMTTLLVRELTTVQGDDLVAQGHAALVAAVFATAAEWLEVALVTPSTEHVLFGIGSAGGALIANLNRLGVQEFRPVEEPEKLLDTVLQVVHNYLSAAEEGYPAAASITRHRYQIEPVAAHLKAEDSQHWTLAQGADGAQKSEPLDSATAFAQFTELLKTPGAAR